MDGTNLAGLGWSRFGGTLGQAAKWKRFLKGSNKHAGVLFVPFRDGIVVGMAPRVSLALLVSPQALMFVAVGDRPESPTATNIIA